MNEIKYVSHISRNVYLYFLLYLVNLLLFQTTISWQAFMIGLTAYCIAYTPVYFVNDYFDQEEDRKFGKANLYLTIQNKKVFWILTLLLLLTGIGLCILANPTSLPFLGIIYFLNILYSVPPIKMRDRLLVREILITCIYFVKWLLISQLLQVNPQLIPIQVIIMSCSLSAFAVAIYKRINRPSNISEKIFGSIFLLSWAWTLISSHQLFWLFLPLGFGGIIVYFFYKNKPIPLGFAQLLYFIYCLIIYLIQK
jgi:4-hydroxybenzoate polyprenyltransferase